MRIRGFVIVKRESEFLLIRESNPKWKNKWFLPGGTVEKDEQLLSAVTREAKEESGFEVGLNGICLIQHYNYKHPQAGLHIFFSARIISGKLKTQYNEHSMEAAWLDMATIETLETRNDLLKILNRFTLQTPLLSSEQVEINL